MKRVVIASALGALVAMSTASATQPQRKIVSHSVRVAATNDEWVSTGIKVEPNDMVLVLVSPTQKVHVGAILGEVNADGENPNAPSSPGRLMMKIGTGASIPAGTQKFVIAPQAGLVKLKVYDSNYADNSGEFEALIIVTPIELIPEAEPYSEQ